MTGAGGEGRVVTGGAEVVALTGAVARAGVVGVVLTGAVTATTSSPLAGVRRTVETVGARVARAVLPVVPSTSLASVAVIVGFPRARLSITCSREIMRLVVVGRVEGRVD